MTNPSKDLWAAQIASPGDPAFDRAHEDFDATVTAYMRSRSLEDLAKIPLQAGMRLTLWRLRAIGSVERTDLKSLATEPLRFLFACRTAVTARMDNAVIGPTGVQGNVTEAAVDKAGAMPLAPIKWIDEQVEEYGGGKWVDEFGDLVLQRANVHPKAPRPLFALLWPLALPRASDG